MLQLLHFTYSQGTSTDYTGTTNFKKIFVSVINLLLIYLFASMKLE